MDSYAATSGNISTAPQDTTAVRVKTTAIFTCILAALAGLMFGLDMGVISGALHFIKRDFAVDDTTLGVIVSIMTAGAAIGALGAGFLSNSL